LIYLKQYEIRTYYKDVNKITPDFESFQKLLENYKRFVYRVEFCDKR